MNRADPDREIDVYGGFSFRSMLMHGKVFLALRLLYKYVSANWVTQEFGESDILNLKMRHMLYFYGGRWFPVQFLGLTG